MPSPLFRIESLHFVVGRQELEIESSSFRIQGHQWLFIERGGPRKPKYIDSMHIIFYQGGYYYTVRDIAVPISVYLV